VRDFRHTDARRPNNPPAGIAPTYEARERKTRQYAYDPHLDPKLVWAGKAEHTSFEVDVVSLHIHERISTRAILESVKKPESQLALFGETPLPADQQIEFYRHEVGWANRLILGDSLLVMNSLLVKEGMAGKVQMVYARRSQFCYISADLVRNMPAGYVKQTVCKLQRPIHSYDNGSTSCGGRQQCQLEKTRVHRRWDYSMPIG
jgi:hypothetical protein